MRCVVRFGDFSNVQAAEIPPPTFEGGCHGIAEADRSESSKRSELSTGPTSEEGKATVARNATTHGFYCRHLILPGETETRSPRAPQIHPRPPPAGRWTRIALLRTGRPGRVEAQPRPRRRAAVVSPHDLSAFFTGSKTLLTITSTATAKPSPNNQKLIATLERSMDKTIAELIKLRKNLDEGIAPQPWANFDAPSNAIVENKPNSPNPQTPKRARPGGTSATMTIHVVQPTPIVKTDETNPIADKNPDTTQVESSETNPIAESADPSPETADTK